MRYRSALSLFRRLNGSLSDSAHFTLLRMKLACPGCGFRTISGEVYGSYDICPVCGWEDDAVQLANPCSEGGANRESLHNCQKCVESRSTEKITAFERDPVWRPLNREEVAYFQAAKRREHWTFMGETAPELAYWQRPRKIESA